MTGRIATTAPNFGLSLRRMGKSMPMVAAKTDAGGAADQAGRPLRSRIGRSVIVLGVILATALAAGFGWFVGRLPAGEIALDRNADGIVVLTGGASRISDAIELLAAGRGKRLLISGANKTTTPGEISRLNPEFEPIVSCCVDFDRSLNTLGNAVETKRWAESRGFRSLIVVTSSYHMPRAIAEIAHQLPGVSLVPFPVVAEKLRAEPWWASGTSMKLIVSEYIKYVVAQVRIRLHPSTSAAAAGELPRA
jgi:uncharacterized SAM-binding protein YcdF (DUF218 family)